MPGEDDEEDEEEEEGGEQQGGDSAKPKPKAGHAASAEKSTEWGLAEFLMRHICPKPGKPPAPKPALGPGTA